MNHQYSFISCENSTLDTNVNIAKMYTANVIFILFLMNLLNIFTRTADIIIPIENKYPIWVVVQLLSVREHAIKSKTPQAYRACRDLGIDYRRAGCPTKIDKHTIEMLCTPRRAGLKTAIYFVRQLGKDSSFHCATFRVFSRF